MKRTMVALSALMCFASAAFAESFINLTTVKQDVVVTDGTRLHAVLPNTGKISIAPNATVTLWMAIIQESTTKTGAGITCMGDATIILEGENYVCGRSSDYPAIYVPEGSTLTIKGTGKLTAIGNGFAAGIGGGDGQDCGNIVIDGGVITAKGGSSSNDGTITYITDDMIIPPGSNYKKNSIVIHPPSNDGGGPGIGAARDASCGKIVFSHGIVEAWASDGYPAIGAKDSKSKCPSVTFKQTIGKVSAVVKGVADDDIISAKNVYYGVVDGVPSGYAGTNTKKTEDGYPGGNKKVIGWNNYRTLSVASQLGSISKHKLVSDYYEVGNTVEWRRTVLRGELSGDYEIALADGAEVVFDCVTVAGALKTEMPGITCWGDAIIILKGENYIKGNGDCYPGIFVPEGHTLKIQGDGSLTVVGGGSHATAIGGVAKEDEDSKKKSGTIRIISGEITAIGGEFASALGSTFEESGRVVEHGDGVEFYGGSVHASGGIPLDGLNSTYLSGGVKMTSDGDEEFFRWNGRLDKVPDALTEVADEVYIVAHDATTIRGKLPDPPRDDYWGFVYDREIRIADGARVTLKDAVVSRPKGGGSERSMEEGNVFSREKKGQWSDYFIKETNTPRYHSGIRCMGDAEITIQGDNSIAGTDFMAGISVADGKKLTLKGDGSLSVYGGKEGGGIDGGSDVIIDGGVINAYGGDGGSGIGASRIEFNGGSTTAIAYETGASQEDLEDFHALGYSESSTIVIGKSLKREKEEVVGYNSSGHFKNCTEKVSFDGDLAGLGEGEEDVAGDDEDDEEDEDGAGEQGGGKKMVMKAASARKGLLGDSDADPDPTEYALTLKNVRSGAIAGTNTVITGTLSGFHKVAIAHDAIVTLRDATIVQGHGDSTPYAGLTCLGNATIRLEGRNYIWSFHAYYPAISVPPGCTLTIEGPGALYAHGGSFGAGIGGGFDMDCGNIVVNGGEIHADGGLGAAGIGGGAKASVGAIVLNGGTIEATSSTPVGTYSPASGIKYVGSAPGIGVGWSGTGNTIYINSGVAKVTAKRGNENCDYIGAGAGGTIDGNEVPVNIGSALAATDLNNTRTLQWDGNLGNVGDFDLSVIALDGTTISGALGGRSKIAIAPGAHVTLDGATIGSISAVDNDAYQHAGITCLGDATITLENENKVYGIYGTYPGIFVPKGSELAIDGTGMLEAESNGSGAGIGGANGIDCGRIVIAGGEVSARGKGGSAAIGAGSGASCVGVKIDSAVTTVYAISADVNDYDKLIGAGNNGVCTKTEIGPGLVASDRTSGLAMVRQYIHDSVNLSEIETGLYLGEYVIQDGQTITGNLSGYRKIVIAHGATVKLSDSTINSDAWSGMSYAGLTCAGDATIILYGNNSIHSYDGKYPGIYVPSGSALTIKGEGGLTVEGGGADGGGGAGIGAGFDLPCGSIFIEGGVITAAGHAGAAGIGGGSSDNSTSGAIRISGGADVTATGGIGAAGIGAGNLGNCAYVWIDGDIAKVVATRGVSGDRTNAIGDGAVGTIVNTIVGVYLHPSLSRTDNGRTATVVVNPGIELDKLPAFGGSDGSVTTVVTARDGGVISGTMAWASNGKIVIADGATVTLRDVKIEGVNNANYEFAGITCEGDATIILEGENRVIGFWRDYPGIYVPAGKTLTIKGDGSLYARTQGQGAGIGAGFQMDCGNIVIESGTVFGSGRPYDDWYYAVAGGCGAGIGGSGHAVCGDITIIGGYVEGIGAGAAAGIGGAAIDADKGKGCGDITILGGVVEALGGSDVSAGIGAGGGWYGSCGTITIGSGVQSVVASTRATANGYQPIGACPGGEQSVVSISGALLDSTYDEDFGNDDERLTRALVNKLLDLGTVDKNTVHIYDGMTVTGTLAFPAKLVIPVGAHITLHNATIDLEDGDNQDYGWAGLNCVGDATITLKGNNTVRGFYCNYPGIHIPQGCVLTIDGSGSLSAFSNGWGAGIGGGFDLSCGYIVINGGTINAEGGSYAAGIGGGAFQDCGAITINDGNVSSLGGDRAAGIGGGLDARCGAIAIGAGVSMVQATRGDGGNEASEPIGRGDYNGDESSSSCDGLEVDPSLADTTSADGRTRAIKSLIANLAALNENCTLEDHAVATGTLAANVKLSIAAGATVTLRDVAINGANEESYKWAGITCEGDATIILEGSNTVRGFYEDYPGIHVPQGSTLTIRGDGSLDASSNGYGAGIGGGYEISCGNIVIEGGAITATGGSWTAGIGGGNNSACGNIVIEGGAIIAVGGGWAAGIGGGNDSTCGDITITRGVTKVTAIRGNSNSYSIGSGYVSDPVKVTIDGVEGQIETSPFVYMPAWNGNLDELDGDVTVTDGTVITGSLKGGATINIAEDATIVLYDAYIEGSLNCLGKATIVLKRTTRIVAPSGHPAIQAKAYGEEATITGSGSLVAISDGSWLLGYYLLDGLMCPSAYDNTVIDNGDGTKTYIVAPSPTLAYDTWASDAGVSGVWNATDVATGVANAFRYAFAPTEAEFEEIAESGMIDIAFDDDGSVVILTPEIRNDDVFKLSVVASDEPDGTGNAQQYPLQRDGCTAIDESSIPGESVNRRFYKVIAVPRAQ